MAGQAAKRGTREERVAAAIKKKEEEKRRRQQFESQCSPPSKRISKAALMSVALMGAIAPLHTFPFNDIPIDKDN